jgi:hypothetical protein
MIVRVMETCACSDEKASALKGMSNEFYQGLSVNRTSLDRSSFQDVPLRFY